MLLDPNGDTIRVSDALLQNEMAYTAYQMWTNSEEGKAFHKLFGEGGKFGDVNVTFGVDAEKVGDAKGDTRVNAKGENGERPLELGDGLENGEHLSFDVNINPGTKTKAGDWGHVNGKVGQHTKESAQRSNNQRTLNKASTILHESQHVEIITRDVKANNRYDIHPYYQHKDIMKNPNYKYYNQRKNFYNRYNIYNMPYDPNGFDN